MDTGNDGYSGEKIRIFYLSTEAESPKDLEV